MNTNPIYNTTLFKAVAPYINSISPEVLGLELSKAVAKRIGFVKLEAITLGTAFDWDSSPQRAAFWGKIDDEHHKNFRNGRRVTDIDDLVDEV